MGVIILAIISALFFGLALFWIIGALLFFGTVASHIREWVGSRVDQALGH